jgi:ribosomal protein S8
MLNFNKLAILISSIKTACKMRKLFVFVPYTRQNLIVLDLLFSQGCIRYFNILYRMSRRGNI